MKNFRMPSNFCERWSLGFTSGMEVGVGEIRRPARVISFNPEFVPAGEVPIEYIGSHGESRGTATIPADNLYRR